MERDDFTCQSCGDTETTLHVHHKTYRKNAQLWDYDDTNFVTYCDQCHNKIHEEKDFFLTYIDTAEKMRRLATMSYFCDEKHIRMAQIVCGIALLEKGKGDDISDYRLTIELAKNMIASCENIIKYAEVKLGEQ